MNVSLSQLNRSVARFFYKFKTFNVGEWYERFRFNEVRQLDFLMYFSTWLSSGAVSACNAIIDTGSGVSSRTLDVKAARAIKSSLEKGEHISVGLERMFSPTVVLLFRAAQKSDDPKAIQHMLDTYLRQETEISVKKKSLIRSLVYPFICLVMGLITNAGMAVLIDKAASKVGYENVSLIGHATLAIGEFATSYSGVVLFALFIFYVVGINFCKRYTGERRKIVDRVYPFSLYKAFCAMRTLRILGLLIEYKSSVRDALGVLSANEVPYVKSHLDRMLLKMKQSGISLHVAMNTGFMQEELLYRLKLEMGHQDEKVRICAVSRVADFAGVESARKLQASNLWTIGVFYALAFCVVITGFSGMFEMMSLMNSANPQ